MVEGSGAPEAAQTTPSPSDKSDYVDMIRRGSDACAGLPNAAETMRVVISAKVVKGFGRGSKLLGIPTANMNMAEVGHVVDDMPTGIYFGFVQLAGVKYKAVVSIGWNPYFKNKEKTVEPHVLHEFPEDFYGEQLQLLICGYIRPEMNFHSLDDLIRAIKTDIAWADQKLDMQPYTDMRDHDSFWQDAFQRSAADT